MINKEGDFTAEYRQMDTIIFLLILLVVIALGILLAMIAIFYAITVSKVSKDEKIFSAFIRSLMRAEEIEACVLSLPCNSAIASAVGLRISPAETIVRFVLREEYVTLWKRLDTKFKAEGAKEAIIIGTSGIGKSMFRFYILREWLFERINVGCEFVVLNLDEAFYLIDRKGTLSVSLMRKYLALKYWLFLILANY